MSSPQGPAAHALADLDQLLPTMWEALEAGTADAQQYFDDHDERSNPTLYPGLVRYRAIQVLESAGVEAAEFERANLSNNGIEVRYGRYRLRILKADHGEVPRAGSSARKRDFYCQGSLFPSGEVDNVTNLLLLWDYDRQGLTGLTLAHPVAAESTSTGVKVDWLQPLPHPADATGREASAVEDEDDLPITYRREIEEGEDAG